MIPPSIDLSLTQPHLAVAGHAAAAGGGEAALREVAERFEAVLLGQLVREARLMPQQEGAAAAGSSVYRGMVEQSLGEALAAQGGLGLADALVRALGRPQTREAADAAATPHAPTVDAPREVQP